MEENQQLIDFLAEDDYLIDFPFRDSLEDLRLSVTFENKNEHERIMSSENAENECPRRPSFLRKSLAWDSAFFTSAGVLDPEELVMINKGFKKSDAHDQLPRIREQLETEDLKPDGTRFNVTSFKPQATSGKTSVFSKEVKPMPTLTSQSLTPRGSEKTAKKKNVIRPQIPKRDANTSSERSDVLSHLPPKISGRPNPISARRTKRVPSPADLIRMGAKTRKAGSGPDVTVSKKSRLGDLSGLTTTSIRDSTVSCSYESLPNDASSSTYKSKSMRNEKNKKPSLCSSVHLPLMSNWSSSTSPASSTDGWSLSPAHGLHTPTSESSRLVRNASRASGLGSRFQDLSPACRNSEEANDKVRCSKRRDLPGTKPCSAVPKADVKSSGLRMPSPKIGFFDEATVKGSAFEGHSFNVSSNEKQQSRFQAVKTSPGFGLDPAVGAENRSKTVRKSGRSSSKSEGHRTETASRNKLRIEQKKRRDDTGCVLGEVINLSKRRQDKRNNVVIQVVEDEKENIGAFDDQVVGLSKYLEVIHLENDVVIQVDEKPSYSRPQPQEEKQYLQKTFPKPLPTSTNSTPCTRTPFAVL